MPHYKDGTAARVGDHVIGKPYNTNHEVAGTVVSISPSADSCNLQIEFIESIPSPTNNAYPEAPRMFIGPDSPPRLARTLNHSAEGNTHARYICRDYGEVKAFSLVGRPAHTRDVSSEYEQVDIGDDHG